jgi:hypothetical protein
MSDKKTIRVNPELFNFSRTNKTKKKQPRDPNKPIRLKPDLIHNRTVKNTKKQLLKYIREQQEKNYKRFSEPQKSIINEPKSSRDAESSTSGFESDFENSLKYLSSVAEKAQKTASTIPHNITARNLPATARNLPATTEALLMGSTLGNMIPYDNIGLELPNVFSDIEPSQTTDPFQIRSRQPNILSAPKYGCLKNGTLPTYREWKNQTVKTYTHHPPKKRSTGGISSSPSLAQSSQPLAQSSQPLAQSPNGLAQSNTIMPGGGGNPSYIEQTTRIPFSMKHPSSIGGVSKKNIVENARGYKPIITQQKQRMKKKAKNKKQKRTLRRTFRLGKSKHYPNISVLVSNKTIRNQITTKTQLLKQVPIEEIKKTLMKKGLIKVGTTAPNDVLRKMYESVSLLCGDIYNHNSENLLFNYFNGGTA